MKYTWLLLLALSGCSIPFGVDPRYYEPPIEVPTVNIPQGARQWNWSTEEGGSCTHASMMSLFRWMNQPKLADWWKRHHGGGEYPASLHKQLDAAGIPYAATAGQGDVKFLEWAIRTRRGAGQGDVKFLEWAIRTRRGAGVTVMGGTHMVALVHLDDQYAGILDNNSTGSIIWLPRDTFISEWLNSNSWALTPLFSPASPIHP